MLGIGELMILMVPLLGIWIWMVADCALHEPPQDRTMWLLITILTGVIGALIYLIYRRPQRRAQFGR